MDFRSAVRKVCKVRLKQANLAETDLARARARMVGKDLGFLRVTRNGYDYGPNPDPDGIMLTLRKG